MNFQIQASLAGVIRKARHQNFPLQNALLELIDNSIDEDATAISICENGGDLIIEDNGKGFADIGESLVVGKSSKVNRIGRYGVGLKDASVRYSESTVIESRGVRVRAPWDEIADGYHDGLVYPDEIENSPITRIILEGFRDRYTAALRTDDIRRVYYPLLHEGEVRIDCNGVPLKPLELPVFTTSISETFEYRGKVVRLEGGIFKPNDPLRKLWAGYNPYYKGRLIGPGKITTSGVGDVGCTNFAFILHLEDGEKSWGLATNKDDFAECHELLEHCYDDFTATLLKKGAEETQHIELKEIEALISAQLNVQAASGNQTRKNKGEKKGSIASTCEGVEKRFTHTAKDAGRYFNGSANARRSALDFKFAHLGGLTLGDIQDQGKRMIITANLDNGFIETHKTNEAVILCVAKIAYSLRKQLSKDDTVPDELVSSIMVAAGTELS